VPDFDKTEILFRRTLELAKHAWGNTHPNPMVGAIIVEAGEVVSEGYHKRAGSAHAEVAAISNLGRSPNNGSSMFVSLEPCSTHGRTPPCVDAILKSGIKNVFIGCLDPNPEHAGRGIQTLEKAGISVHLGSKEIQAQATRLNFVFNHNMLRSRPLIALKMAETKNGMVAEIQGVPSRITEVEARANMMHWRRFFPSICVGAGTVLSDDPSLTARFPGETWCPLRIIVDSNLVTLGSLVPERVVYTDEFADRTIILTTSHGLSRKDRVTRAEKLGVRLLKVAEDETGRTKPDALRFAMDQFEVNAVYCEGGPTLAQSLLNTGNVDYLFKYLSPKVFVHEQALSGPNFDAFPIKEPIEESLGKDHLTHGFL
jgi:diaminohydroxyphosphoribosylaminopyrimidine deaminase/5-amino-6-(5-phosphoribosylamino)uracil reductase